MALRAHLVAYRCALNLNFIYNFGFLVGLAYAVQIISGLWLATRYSADGSRAFKLVHELQREVPGGWFIRRLHGTVASAIFALLTCHVMRTLWVGSYIYLSTAWLSGLVLYVLTIGTAFVGYVLPWGLMSFWGATVITNLLAVIPMVVPWILGGFYVTEVTLRRFYVIHFILPLVAFMAVAVHIFYLHLHGSSNPLGIHTSFKAPFVPWFFMGDVRAFMLLAALILVHIGLALAQLSHPDNSMPVNRLITPLHIVPEWYFLAYYATLKAIPNKTAGLAYLMGCGLTLTLLADSRRCRMWITVRVQDAWRNVQSSWAVLWFYVVVMLVILGGSMPQTVILSYSRLATVSLVIISLAFRIN